MAKKSGGRGLSSSAGLVTYYDADNRKALHIGPKTILITVAAVGIIIYVLEVMF